MSDDIELISDGDGLAVVGDARAVDRFLTEHDLLSRDLGLQRLGPALSRGAAVAQAGSQVAAQSGRWVKLTKDSAEAVRKYGLSTSKTGKTHGVFRGADGRFKGVVELSKGPGTLATNPALLAGAAGLMAQLAMQQTMDEILDYLERIDKKVDDVLRGQKDAVLADVVGADLVIEEAMTVREQTGRVSEVTWSKVQALSLTIARTQAYAVRRLDALAESVEAADRAGDLAEAAADARAHVREWLAVLALCFRLQDAHAVLELDRVLDASYEELDHHRLALTTARRRRADLITSAAGKLTDRLDAAAARADERLLLHPMAAKAVVTSRNDVAEAVGDFRRLLGHEADPDALEGRRWVDAAAQARDRAIQAGGAGLGAARSAGVDGVDLARSLGGRLAGGLTSRTWRRASDTSADAEPPQV